MVAQGFIPAPELIILTGIQTNEASAEIVTQPRVVETKISKCSTWKRLNTYMSSYIFYSLNHYVSSMR